ncbi:MAG: SemiSWEET family transporter [Actinobacteria bacterium]|nr:SemiSWEET family transporter [Actinomycetota bacterium]MCL5446900.1 SemiSWEET family transporter [Actinomycetota bacterium]
MIIVFGIIASTLTTACWIPQVYRSLSRKSAKDFSWIYLLALITGVTGWLVYGALLHDPIIWASNAAVDICTLFIVTIKMYSEIAGFHRHKPLPGTHTLSG